MTALAHQPFLFTGPQITPNWPWGNLEPHGYDLVMIDPPWRFELYSAKGESKSAQANYRTMSLDDIAALPVMLLAKPDCLVWLWATAPMLPMQLAVLARWGFAYKSEGVWIKTTVNEKIDMGLGYTLRNAHEPFLIASTGSPKVTHGVRSVVMGRNHGHSRKPDAAYDAAERLMPHARRCDLFSRKNRPGWDAWGDEVGKYNDQNDGVNA